MLYYLGSICWFYLTPKDIMTASKLDGENTMYPSVNYFMHKQAAAG